MYLFGPKAFTFAIQEGPWNREKTPGNHAILWLYRGKFRSNTQHRDRTWLVVMVLNLISLVGLGILFTQRWGAPGMATANYLLAGTS